MARARRERKAYWMCAGWIWQRLKKECGRTNSTDSDGRKKNWKVGFEGDQRPVYFLFQSPNEPRKLIPIGHVADHNKIWSQLEKKKKRKKMKRKKNIAHDAACPISGK